MSFLDNNGLAYFYDKLKGKFAQTVNGVAPVDGNISITNVATADNLTSNDGVEFYSNFIYRIAGGDADISNGDAYLMYIEGNSVVSERVEEVVNPIGANGIIVTIDDLSTWRTAIDDAPSSGTISFIYNRPVISSTSTSSSWTDSGSWKDSSNNEVSLSTYGLVATGIVDPAVSIQKSSTGFDSAFVVPYTFMNATSSIEATEFVFEYDEDLTSWMLNEQAITLGDYGLSISTGGVPDQGDLITVTRIKGTVNTTINIQYQKPDRGIITNATPSQFAASGFNQFNKDSSNFYLSDYTISSGEIVPSIGKYVCYCRALAGSPSGYVAYSSGGYLIPGAVGYCSTVPSNGTQLTQTEEEWDKRDAYNASLMIEEDGYFVVAVSNKDDLCIHIRWDDEEDEVYEEYVAPSTINIPSTAKDGTSLPLASYGMPALGAIKDKLVMDNGTDEGTYIQKIERIAYTEIALQETISSGVAYDYDRNWIYRALTTPVSYTVATHALYEVNDLGTEEFLGTTVPVWAENLYGENLRNKLKVNTLTISEQNPSLNDSQKQQVQENLGFISEDFGGELADTKQIILHQRASVNQTPLYFADPEHSAYTVAQRPSSDDNKQLLWSVGKDGYPTGSITQYISASGTAGLALNARNYTGSGTVTNYLRLTMTPTGDAGVIVASQAAWRKALGLGDANGALPITLEQGGTGATNAATARTNLGVFQGDTWSLTKNTSNNLKFPAGTRGLVFYIADGANGKYLALVNVNTQGTITVVTAIAGSAITVTTTNGSASTPATFNMNPTVAGTFGIIYTHGGPVTKS